MRRTLNKRIVFYIGSLAKGGAERVITNLAEHFFRSGYSVFIVTKLLEDDEYAISEGITRIIADITPEEETDSRIRNLYRRIRKLHRIFKEVNPDLIVSFIGKNNLMAVAAAGFLHIPVYVSVRSDPKREIGTGLNYKLTMLLFAQAAGIILQTNQAKEFFPERLRKKVVILPNSLNPQFVRPWNEKERSKTIVSVGRLDDNKNEQLLIEAFAALYQKFPEWKLDLYGDGENYEKLKQLIMDVHMQDKITLKGNRPNIDTLISDASIFALTSKVEGMPNALIEAMALGLAVVSTDCPCGGPAMLIQNGKNGLLIPVDDKEALIKALEKLMFDQVLRQKMGREAYCIIELLHPDVVNRQWMDYLVH